MHLTHSNPSCLATFGLDGSNLTQSNSNPWIQTGPLLATCFCASLAAISKAYASRLSADQIVFAWFASLPRSSILQIGRAHV